MKVLFEVPLAPLNFERSTFSWLSNRDNRLFIIEDGKRIRTFATEQEPPKELQSATLMDTKSCTSLAWNHNSTLLALVVDKHQIYLWDMQSNQFTIFKPSSRSSSYSANRRAKSGDIETIAWSQVSNKLVLGYSTGKLLLCNFAGSEISERFVDNSEGILERVTSIESSKHLDLFVCITVISEVLVMSFSGEVKFYAQIEDHRVMQAKFSQPFEEFPIQTSSKEVQPTTMSMKSVWLACQVSGGRLLLKKIPIKMNSNKLESSRPNMDIVYNDLTRKADELHYLVDFYFLESDHLLTCFSSGSVMLHQILNKTDNKLLLNEYFLTSTEILNLSKQEYGNSFNETSEKDIDNVFKSFELINMDSRKRINQSTVGCSSMIAATNHRLFYYELFKLELSNSPFTFEKVDDLDLTNGLKCKGLKLERVKWSLDCSMLAIQLTNAHMLVYRTRLQNYLVASNGSKTAYLSDTNEVTILDYELTRVYQIDETSPSPSNAEDDETSPTSSHSNNKALIVTFESRPSVIAVGSKHLAMALNNQVWFYQIASSNMVHLNDEASLIDKQEYAFIVVEVQLSSRFVAVLFSNGRLKLHAIQSGLKPLQANKKANEKVESDTGEFSQRNTYYADFEDEIEQHCLDDERFFPDPARSLEEHITTFTLTEELFLYCTKEGYVNVFSLKSWALMQSYCYSEYLKNNSPIEKMIGNERGNKFVCLLKESPILQDNVYLYDLYSNKLIKFFAGSLYARIFKSQLPFYWTDNGEEQVINLDTLCSASKPKLHRVTDAIWDSDGRTVHLVSGKFIHSALVLDHTLEGESEGTVIESAATISKPLSYRILYASNGIISYQTSLGRVINSILESHNDELKLTSLKSEIESVLASVEAGDGRKRNAALLDVMQLKIEYFRSILSIHPVSKCREIADYLTSDNMVDYQQSFSGEKKLALIDQVIWKQLAARALFTLNLNFALAIYRKCGLVVFARVLSEIMADALRSGQDIRCAIKTRLLVLLGCERGDSDEGDHVSSQ